MKRKRGSTKRKPRKISGATDVLVDPGYYSDNRKNDGSDSLKETRTKDVNVLLSSTLEDLSEAAIHTETTGSAAAKLARALSSSRAKSTTDEVRIPHPRIGVKEPKTSHSTPVFNKEELEAAQMVIKKVMKMDAAIPFNTAVDPIALGIPDYFDIVNTPMDFGTIFSKLEKGLVYKNSEDVFKDVQYIWDNCCKYNKKGSYILDLMKRVKTNFMKQWTAAGLYKEQSPIVDGHHLPQNTQPFAESTMMHANLHMPVDSNIRNSAYLNQGQQPPLSPCYNHALKTPPVPYPYPWQSHPEPHQQGLVPPPHYAHMHYMDPMYRNAYNPWANEAGPSYMHPYHPPHSFSHMGPPQQRTWQHQSSSSKLLPPQLHADINAQSTGHLRLPHEEHSPAFSKNDNTVDSGRNTGDGNHRHHQMDIVPIHDYQTAPSYVNHQSTYHQWQSSQVGGASKGTLPALPPTESTVKGKKSETRYPRSELIVDISHQLDEINPTHEEHSSSMNNIEVCHSPLELVHSTPENNICQRQRQDKEHVQYQELAISTDSQELLAEENNSQSETASPKSRPSAASADNDKVKKIKKKTGRGPTRDLFKEAERISVITNELGQPVGPESQRFSSFLGTLARNGNFLPLSYTDWRSVPLEYKEALWEKVQSRCDIDPSSKDWVLHSLSLRWKNWKSMLKTTHYNPHETDEERLADCDDRVLPDQWAALIALWSTEAAQKRSAISKASRAQMKYNHATGRKSFARIREEQKAKMPEGKELSRTELFILTRTRKDGKAVNEETSEVIDKLRRRAKEQDNVDESNKKDDLLTEIIGPKKNGLSRCVELSPNFKPTRIEAIKMASDANTEIHEMKQKMSVMEKTCLQMSSQMAAMMSMMSSLQKNGPDKNVTNVVATTSGASDLPVPVVLHVQTCPTADAVSPVATVSGASDQFVPKVLPIQSPPTANDVSPVVTPSGASNQSTPEALPVKPTVTADPVSRRQTRGSKRKSRP